MVAWSPLTTQEPAVSLACFHLEAGEFVGEHQADARQLFCVVAGEGWVSGNDGAKTAISSYQATVWDAGEMHAAGTDTGLTAIVLEGDEFDPWLTVA